MSKKVKGIAIGAAIAAGVGYLAGILTAPKSGKETRKDIEKVASKAKRDAEQQLKNLHAELSDLLDRVATGKDHLKKDAEHLVDRAQSAKNKAREMLSAIHEGDADDKDLKRAITEVNDALAHLKKYLSADDKTSKKA